MDMTVREMVGHRIGVGFAGTEVNDRLRRLVADYKISNIILFRDNLTSAEQATRLCAAIQALVIEHTGHPALIAIDQEGGVVTRLPSDMLNVPGAMALATTGDPDAAYEAAVITARELRRIGVNFNLAPVLDVNSNSANPAIGVRSYGATPQVVARFSAPVIRAFREEGVLCCAKHFPGHGDTSVDSHLDLPVVDKPLEELERTELAPFAEAIRGGIPAIMSTHILFPQVEKDGLPATLSRGIMTGLLRERMGFEGLIVSDGMEMNAIKARYGVPRGCEMALDAGVDIVYICHDSESMEATADRVAELLEAGQMDRDRFEESVCRILDYKQRYAPAGPIPAAPNAAEANAGLMRRTLAVAGGPATCPPLGEKPLFAGCLAYRSTIASTAPDSALDFAGHFAGVFGGVGVTTPVNPVPADYPPVLEAARDCSSIVFGTYNGHLNRGQLELARQLADVAGDRPMVVVALRNPYDLFQLEREGIYRLATFEYSANSFAAVEEVLRGGRIPEGRLENVL